MAIVEGGTGSDWNVRVLDAIGSVTGSGGGDDGGAAVSDRTDTSWGGEAETIFDDPNLVGKIGAAIGEYNARGGMLLRSEV